MNLVMTLPRVALLGLTAALFAPGCAEDEPPDDPVGVYLSETWGITVSGFAGWDGSQFEIREDGTAVARGEGIIHVEGLGSKAVSVDEEVAPQSRGGVTTLVIGEQDGDVVYLSYDPVLGRVAFGDLTTEMGVDANPDGTFRVWRFSDELEADETLATTDGVGSYQHVEANGGLEDDSPYLLLMAFVLGQSPVYEARSTAPTGTGDIEAGTPVACDLFRELCECVACHAKDGVGCDACPTLER